MEARDSIRSGLAPAASAFFSGVLLLLVMPDVPPREHVFIVACIALVALLGWHARACRLLMWACCGFLFASAHAHFHHQRIWPSLLADERVKASARIEGVPRAVGQDLSFDARLRIQAPSGLASGFVNGLRVRLVSRDPEVAPRAGETWELLVALRPPRSALNPGALDFERVLFQERIHALGTVVPSRLNRRVGEARRSLDAIRERIALRIERNVHDRDAAALLAALAVGVTGSMSREQWRVFNATGTTHLVAISGLHVTLFALVAIACARRLWSAVAWKLARWTRDGFAASIGMCAATAYAMLAGFSIPTQRTLIMLAAWLLARVMARHCAPQQPIAVALVAVLLLDPFAPLTPGFWLSFAAMATIVLVSAARVAEGGTLRSALSTQAAVAVTLVPMTVACFGSVSLIGPLVNLVAIPLFTGVLVPLTLLALVLMPVSPGGSDLALATAAGLHDLAWPWLVEAADQPWALEFANPSLWAVPIIGALAAVALAPWPARMRLAIAAAVLPLLASRGGSPTEGDVRLDVLDVGNGSAFVVRTANHVLVHGTGESYGTHGNRAERVVIAFLRSCGIRSIDRLAVPVLDGISGPGVTSILASMTVGEMIVGEATPDDFTASRACGSVGEWVWDGIRFRASASCEISIDAPGGRMRLSGGVAGVEDARGASWLLVSGRRSGEGRARRAQAAAVPPGARVWVTGEAGAIRVTLRADSRTALPVGQRQARPALWRGTAAGGEHKGRRGPV